MEASSSPGEAEDRDRLVDVYLPNKEKFGLWEEFPYPYFMKARRLLCQSAGYNTFFEKYDKQKITKTLSFFNFCKSVIYQYSPSFKEEILHQESLVRLFAGVYYVVKYGRFISSIVGLWHILLAITHFIHGRYPSGAIHTFTTKFTQYTSIEWSYTIIIVSVFAFFIFWYMNHEILGRLRPMRLKELNLAYDAFYLICQKEGLEL